MVSDCVADATEEWRAVVGYEGLYEVSNCGRVRAISSIKGCRFKGIRLRKLQLNNKGYYRVDLFRNSRGHKSGVHQLVAAAFIGPCPCGLEINHIDNNPKNNRVSNLEYVTKSENRLHAVRQGRVPLGEEHTESKLTEKAVRQMRLDREAGVYLRDLAVKYGVSHSTVQNVIYRRWWRHVA